jgi:hypothetical protein
MVTDLFYSIPYKRLDQEESPSTSYHVQRDKRKYGVPMV